MLYTCEVVLKTAQETGESGEIFGKPGKFWEIGGKLKNCVSKKEFCFTTTFNCTVLYFIIFINFTKITYVCLFDIKLIVEDYMQVYQDYAYITHKRNILCLFFQFLCIFHIVFFSEKWSTQLVILCIVLDCWSDKIVVKDSIFYNWGSQVCRFKVSICIHSTYFFIQCVMQYFFTNMFTRSTSYHTEI